MLLDITAAMHTDASRIMTMNTNEEPSTMGSTDGESGITIAIGG